MENLNFGMHQLITREHERLGISLLGRDEIWANEDTSRPGYEGYVHFQVERGFPLLADNGENLPTVLQSSRDAYPTKERKEKVFTSGNEFISTMKMAALSIGTAAVYGKPQFCDLTDLVDSSAETDLFWLHLVQSWISLGAASERLRTFFIEFVRCEREKKLDRELKGKLKNLEEPRPKQFVFKQAFRDFELPSICDNQCAYNLVELKTSVDGLATIKETRNDLLHKFSSREAMIIAQDNVADESRVKAYEAFMGNKSASDFVNEVSCAYKILVVSGNLVFSLENCVKKCDG